MPHAGDHTTLPLYISNAREFYGDLGCKPAVVDLILTIIVKLSPRHLYFAESGTTKVGTTKFGITEEQHLQPHLCMKGELLFRKLDKSH